MLRNGHVAVVRALLERGANIEAKEGDGSTPLYVAAQNGHVEVVKLLLTKRANPETSFLVRIYICTVYYTSTYS